MAIPFAAAAAAAARAAAARGAAGGAARGAAGAFGPGSIGRTVGQKYLEYGFVIPGLQGLGLIPGPHPAPPMGPAGAAGVTANLRYANPQPAWWDALLFKGQVNKLFGPPRGFEYEKLDKTDATNRRGQDLQLTGVREQVKGRIKVADLTSGRQLEGQKYTADQRLKGQDLTSSRQLQGTQYTADRRLQGQDIISSRMLEGRQYQSDRQLEGTQYRSDRQLQGTQYTADRRLQGQDLTSGRQLEGVKYRADRTVDVAKVNAGGRIRVAEIGFEGRKLQYGPGGSVDRTNTSREKIADVTTGRKLEGIKYTADRNYQGRVESTAIKGYYDVAREGVKGDYSLGREEIKQRGGARIADIKGGYQLASAEATGRAKIQAESVAGGYRLDAEREKSRVASINSLTKASTAGFMRF